MAEEEPDEQDASEDQADEEESEEELEEVETSMTEEETEPDSDDDDNKPIIDSDGRFYGTGRRKKAVARVWIEAGNGDITVNETSHDQYFMNRKKWTKAVEDPLECVNFEDDVDVWATAEGGGLTGQADALKLGIARALVKMDQNARNWLKDEGYLTRDDREVERKKVNQPGARAKQQVSKR